MHELFNLEEIHPFCFLGADGTICRLQVEQVNTYAVARYPAAGNDTQNARYPAAGNDTQSGSKMLDTRQPGTTLKVPRKC